MGTARTSDELQLTALAGLQEHEPGENEQALLEGWHLLGSSPGSPAGAAASSRVLLEALDHWSQMPTVSSMRK